MDMGKFYEVQEICNALVRAAKVIDDLLAEIDRRIDCQGRQDERIVELLTENKRLQAEVARLEAIESVYEEAMKEG